METGGGGKVHGLAAMLALGGAGQNAQPDIHVCRTHTCTYHVPAGVGVHFGDDDGPRALRPCDLDNGFVYTDTDTRSEVGTGKKGGKMEG